jgi:uncharacterized CHY-type Zn-finger protein
MYTCKRCGYETTYKHNLIKHLSRKTICNARESSVDIATEILIDELTKKDYNNVTYDCDYCKKKFNNNSNCKKHMLICKLKPVETAKEPECMNLLMKELQALKEEMKALKGNGATQIGNQQNIAQQNITINVNKFGEENTSHISDDFLTECVIQQNQGMLNLLRLTHFDPEHPENHNIRMLSKKQGILEFVGDGRWVAGDKNTILNDMIRRGYQVLFPHFINNIDHPEFKDREDVIHDYFMKISSHMDNCYYQLRRDLYIMIFDKTLYILGRAE